MTFPALIRLGVAAWTPLLAAPAPSPGSVDVRGDVTRDGRITSADGLGVLSSSVGKALPEGWEPAPYGDVDCDGAHDSADALVLLRYLVDLDVSGTCVGNPLLVVVEDPLPVGETDVAYAALLTSVGGVGAVSWSLVAGAPPPGLALDPVSGLVSGTPTADGIAPFTVEAMSEDRQVASGAFTIRIGAQPIWTTSNDGLDVATMDPASGMGTAIGAHGFTQGWAAAFDPDGTLYTLVDGFSGNARLATVDLGTGVATPVGTGVGASMISLEFDAAGTLYGVGYNDQTLYTIDTGTGTATAIGGTGINLNMDLAFDSGGTLYATVGDNLWTVDVLTGASTLVGAVTGVCTGGAIMGIMFDEADVLYATNYASAGASCLMSIDLETLAATVVGLTGLHRPHGGDFR